jgi:hypothetical protein
VTVLDQQKKLKQERAGKTWSNMFRVAVLIKQEALSPEWTHTVQQTGGLSHFQNR